MEKIKILDEALKNSVSINLKKEFFEELRNLCGKYDVYMYTGIVDFPEELKDNTSSDEIPAILFEFHDGSSYAWSDGELNYGNCNTFEAYDYAQNDEDAPRRKDLDITVNGLVEI